MGNTVFLLFFCASDICNAFPQLSFSCIYSFSSLLFPLIPSELMDRIFTVWVYRLQNVKRNMADWINFDLQLGSTVESSK